MERRAFLAAAATAGVAGCGGDGGGEGDGGGGGGTAAGTGDGGGGGGDGPYGGWFDDVPNFDGTVDRTGTERVEVAVGTEGNGGPFAFAPAAVAVSPGTTVRWRWVNQNDPHDVVATDDSFRSELANREGHTFEHAFEGAGVARYFCTPHRDQYGMKGAVRVVGER